MKTLKYTIIKSESQYNMYCDVLAEILAVEQKGKDAVDEIELLTLLIEKWDAENTKLSEANPVELLHSLMNDNKLKAKDLVEILGVSKGLVSDILNYKKGLSKDIIRTLSGYFKVSQEAFNRPYKLKKSANLHLRNGYGINTSKGIELAF